MEDIKKIRDRFERGEISQKDMDIETQKKILKLYKEEIEEIRADINAIRNETDTYRKGIEELDKFSKSLDEKEE